MIYLSCFEKATPSWRPRVIHHHLGIRPCSGIIILLAWLALSIAPTLAATDVLGTAALLNGPNAGNNSVVLAVTPATTPWMATANASWLHLSTANQSGTGSTNVAFNCDANLGETRSGTLTIAGQTLTVTQAGSTYVTAAPLTTLVASGLSFPNDLAVDGAGNVYIADSGNQAIKKWTATDNSVTTLVSSGLNGPAGVALDAADNVYIADTGANRIKEWSPANSNLSVLVLFGFNQPQGVAVDGAGNVYIADSYNFAVEEWTVANSNVITLVSSGLAYPVAVAVDGAGNVYIDDEDNNQIDEWMAANGAVTTLLSGLNDPAGVAVDESGNVFIADSGNSRIDKWSATNNTVTTVVSGVSAAGMAVDASGNLYFVNSDHNSIQELPYAFVDPTARLESADAGEDALPVVLPATENLLGPFQPTSDQSWLSISGSTNGVVSFSFSANAGLSRTAHINLLGQTISVTQGPPSFSLGTSVRVEGPQAGSDSVVLGVTTQTLAWTATADSSWLHLNTGNQSGVGSTNVIFSYDANEGATRSGTITIADLTLKVTQAGSTYVAAGTVTELVSSRLNAPTGVAVDGAGNVYIADSGNNAIKEWTAANNTITTPVAGLDDPDGVAVDGAGNIYIADSGDNAIYKWTETNDIVSTLITLTTNAGVNFYGLALDGVGNVYVADSSDNAVKEYTAAISQLTTLVSSGLQHPSGLAVDDAGNVYIADSGNNVVKQWTAANRSVTTLVSSGLSDPFGVAVDGAGNVYIADTSNNVLQRWTAASNILSTLVSSGLNGLKGVAVDGAGNVYIADTSNNAIKELPYAFVDPSIRSEGAVAGEDALPVVLPITVNLLGPFTPTSDQSWLTIIGSTNGVVSFSFAANPGLNRTAHINLLGQSISVTQGAPTFSLGVTARLEGTSAGIDSVVLSVVPQNGIWTATANAAWLHLNTANQSGTGSAVVVFSYDADAGATRSGTLTIGGQTITVTQAGSTYVASGLVTALVSSGLNSPLGLAEDGLGHVFIADSFNNAVKIWTASDNALTTLVSSGLNLPQGVAVDSAGNVFIADTFNSAIKMWSVANSNMTTLVSSGLNLPGGVAVDGAGHVYIADTFNSVIKMWTIASSNMTTLVSSGLSYPSGVAVDHAGNVFIADTHNQAIKVWTAATRHVTTLVSSGLLYPYGVAVDGAGNVFIADTHNQAIKVWTAATSNVTTLETLGLDEPGGVVVDGTGNVYVADSGNNAIKELPYAFVDPSAKSEGLTAGNDVLPAVLPSTENLLPPFAPVSNEPWLAIASITNGVVSFSFTAATSNRVGNITVLGQTISVMQVGAVGVAPPALGSVQMLAKGVLQFVFTNSPSNSFIVLSATNLTLPLSNWTVVGTASNIASEVYQFTSQPTTNDLQRFYRVRSP